MTEEDDKSLRQLEYILKNILYEIVNSIKNAVSSDIGSSPQMLYGSEVDPILRSSTEMAYTLGTTHAAKAVQQEGYLTHSDIDAIIQIASEHASKFWARVDRGIVQKDRQYKSLAFKETPEHLSNAWLVDSIASSLVYTAYNQAIKTKAQKITT